MPLDTKQVISGMLFPANLLANTEKTKSKKKETITKNTINQPSIMQNLTLTQNKHQQLNSQA